MARLNRIVLKPILISIILSLYGLFLYNDIYNNDCFISPNIIKFLSILLCFLLALLDTYSLRKDLNNILLLIGLFLTVIADYIFLIYKDLFPIAIGLFSIVQILYIFRYNMKNRRRNILYIMISFIIIFILYIFIYIFIKEIEFIFPLAFFYAICLFISLKESILQYKYSTYLNSKKGIILLGMVLFVLCDINVGIYNTVGKSNNLVFIAIWLFYLPSQLLLALSGKSKIKE